MKKKKKKPQNFGENITKRPLLNDFALGPKIHWANPEEEIWSYTQLGKS
jgi:hypothetical protein